MSNMELVSGSKLDWFLRIVATVVFCCVLYFVGLLMYNASLAGHAYQMGHRSLQSQSGYAETYLWVDFKSDFKSSEYGNTAFVRYNGTMKEFHDINKSKVVGEWAGEKTKEAAQGFFKGLFKKSKHDG